MLHEKANQNNRETLLGEVFAKKPNKFGMGCALPPKRDQRRFVRWAKIVRFQRQRRFLYQSNKGPCSVSQFTGSLHDNHHHEVSLFSLLRKYQITKSDHKTKQKKSTKKNAEYRATGRQKSRNNKLANTFLQYGLNRVTRLVEGKVWQRPDLVVIARDVDPIEIVCWLPCLCRKMGVPFLLTKSKARLGAVVKKKKVTTLALCYSLCLLHSADSCASLRFLGTLIHEKDKNMLSNIIETALRENALVVTPSNKSTNATSRTNPRAGDDTQSNTHNTVLRQIKGTS
jgi:ribosomal protein L7Ae-like RNA K-turn-binding protein